MSKLPIFIEGYLDETIVNQTIDLIANKSNYLIKREHFFVDRAKGINSVFKKIKNSKNTCIGIIDDDKVKSVLFDDFIFCRNLGNFKLYYLGDKNIHRFLIVFDPACEKWVIDTAISSGLDKSFSFLNDINEFKKFTKTRSINNEIESLIKKLFFQNSFDSVIFRRIVYGIFKRYRI